MSTNLDSRQVRMMRWLLAREGPQSTAQMAADLGLSQRVVRYRLSGVERYLKTHDLELAKKRGVGIWIEGPDAQLKHVRREIQETSGSAQRVFARDERFDLLRARLLAASPAPISLEQLHEELQVSKTSARRDAKRAEPWLENQGLYLLRKPGMGLSIVGPELSIRRAIVKLVLEVLPTELLRRLMSDSQDDPVRLSAGMAEHLGALPLRECWDLMQEHRPSRTLSDEAEVILPVFLATTAARMRQGTSVKMEPGQLRSLLDHPIAANASDLGFGLAELIGHPVNEADIAAIAELILGLVSLEESAGEPAAPDELVTKMMELAAGQLHPVLRDDAELRRGLSQHLERLVVRLRYGLPVHNPLLAEVSARYPDVHLVATQLAELVEDEVGSTLPEDEVGFITMYLSGAMERTHLWPRQRAVVVCPSGVATAWILVSRIQAEFPQLDLVEVVSARNLDPSVDADMIISTVELTHRASLPPVVVVNPLLLADDIRNIGAIVSNSPR